MNIKSAWTGHLHIIILLMILLAGSFYLLSLYNYLLFHTLIEFTGIIIAFTIFVIGWSTRKYSGNNMIIILAAGYLAVGGIDMLHTITYSGMEIFPGLNSNPTTQFWISARYLEAAAFLLAASFLAKPVIVRPNGFLLGFVVAGMLLAYAVFTGYFPDCYLEGQGLTTFKIASEYTISAILIAGGILFWKKREHLEKNILNILLFAGAFTVMSEISFTLYEDVYGFLNYQGHIFKLISIGLIFNALAYQSFTNPFRFLFREAAEANKKLSDNERKFRDLVEQSPDWIWETDLNGNFVYSNPRAKELTGYSLEDILGNSLFSFMVPDEAGKQLEYLADIAARRIPFCQKEGTILHKNGHPLIFESNGRPVLNEQGQLKGYRGISRDITERKRTENELIQAKEKAEQANLAKSRFLSRMSHEIRNPMNVILGSTDILASTDLSPTQKEWTDMVRDSAESLLGMINDVLDYSEVEAGKLTLKKSKFDIKREVETAVSLLDDQAREKNLQLSFKSEGNIPRTLIGDPDRLQQVVSKVVANAIKFTEKGKVTVTLKPAETKMYRVKNNRREGDQGVFPITISIQDEGIGISPERVDALFQGFYHENGNIYNESEGPGLGLALSKNIVELMGGTMRVKSTLNKGSTVYSTIPFTLPDDAENLSKEPKTEKAVIRKKPGRGSRNLEILLVEDKPMNQKLTAHILEANGHRVAIAENGREALEQYRAKYFDLILMDIHIPEIDGLEATIQIHSAEQEMNRRTPIIALTAYDTKEDRDRFLQGGMDYCVTKPINSDKLINALEEVMGNNIDKQVKQDIPRDDIREMLHRMEGNTELLEELLEMFLLDYHEEMAAIKESLEKGDTKALAVAVHGLKGELGNLGIKSAYLIACELEKLIKDNKLEETPSLLDSLDSKVKGLENFFSQSGWQKQI